MPKTTNGEIELCYDTFGSPTDPALLLIMGLGAQMISWQEGFCRQLVANGFFVIRFDNRDVGLSSKTEGAPPNVMAMVMAALAGGDLPAAPYTLSDMAADAMVVLDDLEITRAHVVGASMGGMIAQTCAIEHADRVLSLTSIMSTTGASDVGQPQPQALTALMAAPPADRAGAIEQGARNFEVIAGPLFDDAQIREHLGVAYDRSHHPIGVAFQLAAIFASGDRTERLAAVTLPTLVVHGAADSLVTLSGGEATAAAIPNARLIVHDEMGHDLPEQLWPSITADIAALLHA